MPTLDELRAKVPQLNGLDDTHAVLYLQRRFYPDRKPEELAQRLGVKAAAGPEPKTRNPFAVANDAVIELANAAASAAKSGADFFVPGNRVSKFIDEQFIKPGEAAQSDVARQSRQQFQDEVQAADGIGGELAAVGRKIVRDPLLTMAQAAGSFVIPGTAVKGAGGLARMAGAGAGGVSAAGLAGGATAGAAMAGGDAAGTAYDLVLKAGGTPEQAEAAARKASVVPAAIGGAGGVVGAERLFAGARGFSGGAVSRAVKTGAVEAAQEGVEEGVTQYEGQAAAVPYDASIDPTKGVAAAAGMGAALGFGTGAGISALMGEHMPPQGPMSRAARIGVATGAPQELAANKAADMQAQENIKTQAAAKRKAASDAARQGMGEAAPVKAPVTTPEMATALASAPAATPVDQPVTVAEATPGAPDVTIPTAPDADGVVPPPVAAPEQPPLIDPRAQREADRPPEPAEPVQPDDVLNKAGAPFTTMAGAMRALKGREATHEIKRVAGGLVLRPKPGAAPQDAAGPVPADSQGVAPAPAPAAPPAPELDMGQAPKPRTVTVNEQTVVLTPEQSAEWDRVGADYKARFDEAQATFERTRRAPRDPNADPDIGARTAKEQLEATRKRLGMELSAERRRIAGVQTPKEQAAAAELASRLRAGDTVETPQGTGTVVRNAFGRVQVRIGNKTVTVPFADAKKVPTPEVPDAPVQPARTDAPPQGSAAPTAEAPTPAGTGAAAAAGVPGAGAAAALETPGVAGKPIDKEWTAFAPETGTKGIPRAEMPQVKAEHRGALTQFLKGRGIAHEQEAEVEPGTLKPTQAEFSPEKVRKAREFTGGDRAILVSNDGHVVDGHHQWAAALEEGKPIRVIRLDAPIDELLPVVKEFPSAEAAAGATAPAQNAAAPAESPGGALRSVAPDTKQPEAAAPSTDAVATWWASASPKERTDTLLKAGWTATKGVPSPSAVEVAGKAWDKLRPNQRDRIAKARGDETVSRDSVSNEVDTVSTASPAPSTPAVTSSAQPLSDAEQNELDKMLGHAGAVSFKDMGGHWMAEATGGGLRTPVRAHGSSKDSARRNLLANVRSAREKQAQEAAIPEAPAPKATKRPPAVEKAAQLREQNLRTYFAPGNVVKSYGGHDEVLGLTIREDGGFTVKVHAVTKSQGSGQWVRIGKPQDARQHSTFPEARELKAGPVAQLLYQPGELVSYTEGRADGKPFANAPDRGVKAAEAPAATAPRAPEAASSPEPGNPEAAPPVGRMSTVPVPDDTTRWMGFDGRRFVRADFQALAQRHPEYYADADAVRQDIDFVLGKPDGWYIHKDRRIVMFRERAGTGAIPQARVEVEADADTMTVRSVYVGNKRQIAKKMADKREVLGGLELGGQSPESLTIAEYLRVLDGGSSLPVSPSGELPKADGSVAPVEGPAPAVEQETSQRARLTDAGEELIRNRRGKLKGLAWDDVSAMNDTLKVAQVVKGNVWPRPDYAKMVEAGAPAWKAAALKAVYDKLAAAPVTRTTPTDADLKAYIETLAQIREALGAELDRVEKAGGDGADLWKALKPGNVFGKVFPVPADAKPIYGAPSPFDRNSAEGKENNRRALLIGGNGAVQALQFGSRTLAKVRDLLADGFPAKQEAWQKSYEVRATETRDSDVPEAERTGQPQQRFYVYEKGSRYRLAKGGQDGGYATQELAEAFARTLTAKKRETLPPSRGLDLADVKRTGPDWRGGKDVTAEQVMQHFGFRGVNLGEYVKAKQGMAQLHLNHVFDAFSDLADLLGVPPKAMSLNGTLGVAIGAQGSGKALAHFVPGVNEINITRDSGAGALAHEFGHAVDHYFATQHGRAASMAKRPYLSAVVETMRDPGGVRPEIIEAMRAVMKTINSRPMTQAEARKYIDEQRTLNQRRMDRWVAEFKGNKGADAAALDAVAEKLKRGDVGEPQETDVETNLSEFMRAAGLTPGNSIAANAFTTAYRLRDLADETRFMASHIPQVDTDYAKASAALDAKRPSGDGYWSTPWEKFARAFETFAMDALADRERESLYLSGLVDSATWQAWSQETGKAIPYPAGAERLELQQAFQKLVDTIETRQDDAGNVAMFSRGSSDPTNDPEAVDGYVPQATLVRRVVRDIAKAWPNGPEIVVAIDMGDAAIPEAVRRYDAQQQSKGATGSVEGFFFGGKVYLLADQLATRADVQRVLFHEVLGHYGLNAAFPGAGLETILDRMAVLQAAKVRAKAKAYGLDMEKVRERRMAAEEVLAELAQQNPQLGWVQKAVAAIRTWLRDNVPGLGRMRLSDDEVIRSFILPARGFVERGRATAEAQGLPAFSRSPALGEALTGAMNNVRDVRLPAGYVVADLFDSAGKMSWWHKSVGTMFDLAQRSPPFKRVFDGLQTFLGGVSDTATAAANQAPRILPKLENWRDLGKTPLSAEDTAAVARPVFEGTLTWGRDEDGKAVKIAELEQAAEGMDTEAKAREMLRRGVLTEQVLKMWQGLPLEQFEAAVETRYAAQVLKPGVVFTDDELTSLFNATPRQIELYREFRSATNTSLHRLAISDMIRFGGKDVEAVREKALATNSAHDAAIVLRDHLFQAAAEQPQRADVLNDTANRMVDKADQVMDLIARGYAPLSRFGQYTLDVVDANGDRIYFGLFEGTAERSKMARELAAAFPGATIRTGTTSEQEFSMFAGVSPETLELFGGMLGLEAQGDDASSKAFQTYLKVAKASRSAMKRLIERKGTAGFSEDVGRVLAGFIYSNARQTASNLHFAAVMDAAAEIPQGQGELKDAALKLINYVKNPQEEAQGFRGLLYFQYLAGSVASAMMNGTQPMTVTLPYLSQYGGAAKATKQVARAIKDVMAGKGTGDPELDAALKKAGDDGIVSPQETHQLMAQAMGRSTLRSGDGTVAGNSLAKLQNGFAKFSLAWGKVFSVAEQSNRRITFIAAYRTAVDQDMADPAKFAADAVDATQFVYTKANRPRWSRGAIGAIAFTFKTYSISYVELLHRMWTQGGPEGKKAALLALAVLFLLSGADGLPFVDDISDVIDGALQRMGYNFSSKQARKEFFADLLGSKEAADFVLKGISGLPGAPIDVSGRMSMSNMIPATGIFLKKTDYSRDLAEIAGPTADLLRRGRAAIEKTVQGDVLGTEGALVALLPVAARNMVKGADMAVSGMYKDDRGYKVIDTTAAEAAFKTIGFQPRAVDQIQEATWEVQRAKASYILAKSEMQARWAKALFDNDPDGVRDAREAFADWNKKNPTQPMMPNLPAIRRRLIEMRKSKEQRIADTAPKAIRQQVREQLREDLR